MSIVDQDNSQVLPELNMDTREQEADQKPRKVNCDTNYHSTPR
jgi:hypothetical protein